MAARGVRQRKKGRDRGLLFKRTRTVRCPASVGAAAESLDLQGGSAAEAEEKRKKSAHRNIAWGEREEGGKRLGQLLPVSGGDQWFRGKDGRSCLFVVERERGPSSSLKKTGCRPDKRAGFLKKKKGKIAKIPLTQKKKKKRKGVPDSLNPSRSEKKGSAAGADHLGVPSRPT